MERLELMAALDDVRRDGDFLSLRETVNLRHSGNVIYDPFSTLISSHMQIGSGNVFYPGTILRADGSSTLQIGSDNTFHSTTLMEAQSGGSILVGDRNTFGHGGFTVRADRAGAFIVIRNRGRYNSGASVYGTSELGNGTQILGMISATDCVLAGGEDFTHPDPDLRGAVLKGVGTARKLHLGVGKVILGAGAFDQSAIQRQTDFHPKPLSG